MLKTKAMMICLASFIHGKMSPVLRGTWSGLWIILCCGLAHNTLALSFQETSSLRHTLHLYSSLSELKQQSHDPCDKTTWDSCKTMRQSCQGGWKRGACTSVVTLLFWLWCLVLWRLQHLTVSRGRQEVSKLQDYSTARLITFSPQESYKGCCATIWFLIAHSTVTWQPTTTASPHHRFGATSELVFLCL